MRGMTTNKSMLVQTGMPVSLARSRWASMTAERMVMIRSFVASRPDPNIEYQRLTVKIPKGG